jgi:hypothetical protein
MEKKMNDKINKEIWHKWLPFKKLEKTYYLQKIIDDLSTLTIILESEKNENEELRIIFDKGVAAYAISQEYIRINMDLFNLIRYELGQEINDLEINLDSVLIYNILNRKLKT